MNHISASLVVVAGLLLVGCSGGGTGGSSSNTPGAGTSEYMVLDLGTNTAQAQATASGISATRIVLKKSPAGQFIGVYPITQAQWAAVMGSAPWADASPAVTATGSNLPAYNLSYYDAKGFCDTLAARIRVSARLPTAGEIAGLAQSQGLPWASPPLSGTDANWQAAHTLALQYAVLNDTGGNGPTAVGSKTDNAGYYDLVGNVRIWNASETLSGGGWGDNLANTSLSVQISSVDPDIRHALSGLRIVVSN